MDLLHVGKICRHSAIPFSTHANVYTNRVNAVSLRKLLMETRADIG